MWRVFVCPKSFPRKKNKQAWNCPDSLILQYSYRSKNFPPSEMEVFVTMSQKGSSCFKVNFHRSCRARGSASIQMQNYKGSKSTLMHTVLVRIHSSFQKVNARASFWRWFWWKLLIYKNRSQKCRFFQCQQKSLKAPKFILRKYLLNFSKDLL